MGTIQHDLLTYSQYIAPLMADFDASHCPGISMIKYASTCKTLLYLLFPIFSFQSRLFYISVDQCAP